MMDRFARRMIENVCEALVLGFVVGACVGALLALAG